MGKNENEGMDFMMKVLILSASTGGGHNRAANALKDYILKRDSSNQVVLVDALEQCSKFVNFFLTKGYKRIAMNIPELYGAMYRNANKERKNATNELVNSTTTRLAQGLLSILDEEKPDVVICTHPFINSMMGRLKSQNKTDVPVISIVTDFIPHRSYVDEKVDAYIAASDETARVLVGKYGVDENLVYALGMPVFQRFYKKDAERDAKTYKQLGFSKDKLTVLVMAGSFGVTDILKIYEHLNRIDFDYQIIIITGKNRRLYNAFAKMLNNNVKTFYTYQTPRWIEKLGNTNLLKILYDQSDDYRKSKAVKYVKNTDRQKPTRLFYYINNVEDYMHVSDLIITKPGGLTTSESLACELPLAIFQAFPGQEEDNANYLVEKGVAFMLKNGKAGARQVEEVLRYPKKLMTMKDNCRLISKGDACENIYNLIENMLSEKK